MANVRTLYSTTHILTEKIQDYWQQENPINTLRPMLILKFNNFTIKGIRVTRIMII
jgi:hypothetical protein